MSEWQPIETAPRDGTIIDLWMTDSSGGAWREANAYWVEDECDTFHEWPAPYHKPVIRYIHRSGWFAPNHDYEGQDGFADNPRRFVDHPLNKRWVFTEPTHWRTLPDPPEPLK